MPEIVEIGVVNLGPGGHVYVGTNPGAVSRNQSEVACEAPLPPECYLHRPHIENAITQAATRIGGRAVLRVVRGPSGSGKTAAVLSVFRTLCSDRVGAWFDCRVQHTMDPQIGRAKVVVFDNLNSVSHPALKEDWFAHSRAKCALVLVTTNSEDVERALVTKFACATDREVSIKSDFFDEAEAFTFLQHTVLHFDEVRAKYEPVVRCAGGRPLAFQILAALIGRGASIAELSADVCSAEDPLGSLLEKWLFECVQNPVTTETLEVLCHLPFVGMSVRTLSAVLNREAAEIGEAVKPLLARGIVAASCRNRTGHEQILAVHETVRSSRYGRKEVAGDVQGERRARYLKYLKDGIAAKPGTEVDLLSCVDAWITCWSTLFQHEPGTALDHQKFGALYRDCEQLLPRIVEPAGAWSHFAHEVEAVLDAKICPEMWCAPLTGLGHLLRNLPPSYSLAEIMWRASRNYDGWGRASAIGVSCSHWFRLGGEARKHGAGKLRQWLRDAVAPPGLESETGIDLLVVLGSLARLADDDTALEQLRTAGYRARFAGLSLPRLALTVRVAERGRLSTDLFHELIDPIWANVTATDLRVADYLLSLPKLDSAVHQDLMDFRSSYRALTPADESAARDVASYTFSDTFIRHVDRVEPKCQIHF